MTGVVVANPGTGGEDFVVDVITVAGVALPFARVCHLGVEGTALTVDVLNAALAALKVDVVNGASTLIDDSVFTVGLSGGLAVMGFADDVSPDSVDEGDVGAIRMSRDRILYVRYGAPKAAVLTAASIDQVAAAGDFTVVTAVAGQTTKLMAFDLWVGAATNLKWKRGTTDLAGPAIMTANGANYYHVLSGEPWGETAVNETLVINRSASASLSGRVWYTTSVAT